MNRKILRKSLIAVGLVAVSLLVLFVMVGWNSMSLLLSFTSVWPGLILTALALVGYFLLPGLFNLWMAVLGGGGMITLGLYISLRW